MAETENDEQPIPLPEEEDRPTLGARIAGIMRPSYMPKPAAVPDAQPAPEMQKPAIDMSKMPDAVKMLTGPASIPQPPTGSNNPNLAELAKKQAGLSMPINPVDPETHKTKQEYRMGIGSRILGTAGNFLMGFGGRGGQPTYVGPGATNNRFAREESQRQGELEGVNTQIGTQQKMDTENERLYRDAIKQAYDQQLGGYREKLGSAAEENAATRSSLADSQRLLNEARANKADQNPQNKTVQAADERKALADQMKLTGEERKSYILTGKLPGEGREPRQPTELDSWMSAFKRDNGRPPTADEIANRKSHTSSKADAIEKDKDTALQKAEAKAQSRIDKMKIFDPADPRPAPQRKQAVYDDLEKEKAQIQKEYETRAAQNAGARPASQPAAKAPAGNYQVGQVVNVKGKGRGKIVGINPTTKKPIVDYSGQ